jgi:hypothetical protein
MASAPPPEPSDVLAAAVARAGLPSAIADTLAAWLEKQLLADQFAGMVRSIFEVETRCCWSDMFAEISG